MKEILLKNNKNNYDVIFCIYTPQIIFLVLVIRFTKLSWSREFNSRRQIQW